MKSFMFYYYRRGGFRRKNRSTKKRGKGARRLVMGSWVRDIMDKRLSEVTVAGRQGT